MKAGFQPPNLMTRRLRANMRSHAPYLWAEYGDMDKCLEILKTAPSELNLEWFKTRRGEYSSTFGDIEIRAVCVSVDFRRVRQWTIETRPVVNDAHKIKYGAPKWQPSFVLFPSLKTAQGWTPTALITEGVEGGCEIEPDGSRGFSQLG